MGEPPRLRRHTDGRLAAELAPGYWVVLEYGEEPPIGHMVAGTQEVSGPGWAEATVVVLPEPDGQIDAVSDNGEDVRTPHWRMSWGESVTAWIEGVETPIWELREDLDEVRADALKMLAAVAECERFRAQREAGDR